MQFPMPRSWRSEQEHAKNNVCFEIGLLHYFTQLYKKKVTTTKIELMMLKTTPKERELAFKYQLGERIS